MPGILSLRYSDILESIGLSHLQATVLVLIIILISALIFFSLKLGIFQKVEFYQEDRPAMIILYTNYQGDYNEIDGLFHQIDRDMESLFRISRNFGFFYDNPQETEANLCRAIAGILVNDGERDKIELFLDQFPKYTAAVLPATNYVMTEYPYFNQMSFKTMGWKVYPRLKEYAKKNDINTETGCLQVYNFLSQDEKSISLMMPTTNQQSFQLWKSDASQ